MLFANNIMKLLFVQSACKDLYKILLMKKVRNPTINPQENAIGFYNRYYYLKSNQRNRGDAEQ